MSIQQMLLGGFKFVPVTNTYNSGSGVTETVPSGARTVLIEINGPGGNGQKNLSAGPPGTGGGGGGYSAKTLTVSGGQTFTLSVGASSGATTTVVNGTGPSVSLTANTGQNGSAGGVGGSASGGDTNTSGGNGAQPTGGSSPNGGAQQTNVGQNGNAPGGGGAGDTNTGGSGGVGAPGRVKFSYT